jgi:hypothetical protein
MGSIGYRNGQRVEVKSSEFCTAVANRLKVRIAAATFILQSTGAPTDGGSPNKAAGANLRSVAQERENRKAESGSDLNMVASP